MTKYSRRLLINPKWTATVSDKGIDWITDRYVMARSDLFKSLPKESHSLSVTNLRKCLAMARTDLINGEVGDSGHRLMSDWYRQQTPAALIGRLGGPMVTVNAECYEAWAATGLRPQINVRGMLLWWGTVRGRDALFGFTVPVRINPPERPA